MITVTRPLRPWFFVNSTTSVSKAIVARRFVAVDTSEIDGGSTGCGGLSDGKGEGDSSPNAGPYRVEGGGLAVDAPLPAIGEMIADQLYKFLLAKYEEGFLDGLAIGLERVDTDTSADTSADTDTPTDTE